jgi:hypothetical protein
MRVWKRTGSEQNSNETVDALFKNKFLIRTKAKRVMQAEDLDTDKEMMIRRMMMMMMVEAMARRLC